jgi:ribonuclease E
MKKEMLINVLQPEECRIAILENNVLEELYVERTSHESYVGNIYKGRIVNIEPSIQAAFVDFGVGRNGFLHVSDVEPQYYKHLSAGEGGKGRGGRARLELAEVLDLPDVQIGDDDQVIDGDDDSPLEPEPSGAEDETELLDAPEEVDAALEEDESDLLDEPLEIDDDDDGPAPRMPSAERHGSEEDSESEGGAGDDSPEPSGFGAGLFDVEPPAKPEREARAERPEQAPAQEGEPADDDDMPPHMEVMDAHEEAAAEGAPGKRERGGRRGRGRGHGRGRRPSGRGPMLKPKPPIQDIFRRGQEVLVQVIKEGIGTKGPTLSTYISIPGRYLVLMPGLNRIGVSRKIGDDDQRRRLREILGELQPPKGLGFIIRTAGLDRNKKELQRDLAYLTRLWKVVVRRIRKLKGPASIYQESDMITRTIRDIFTNEIETIWVDEPTAFEHAQEFLKIVMPRYAGRIKLYENSEPLFHKYGIEREIARIQQRHVPLPNGASLVIEQTEALVAIDVNSGNFRVDNNAEETAYRVNLLAAKEIARQLRLRDLGGVIINDFIDMREDRHRRDVERAMRDAVKRDRARTKLLRISQFGIIEMTRQRIRPSLKRSVFHDCPHCNGNGQVKTGESMSIEVMRLVQLAAHREGVSRVHVRVTDAVAQYLLNRRRREVAQLEENGKMQLTIESVFGAPPEFLEMACHDANGNEVKLDPTESAPTPRGRSRGERSRS